MNFLSSNKSILSITTTIALVIGTFSHKNVNRKMFLDESYEAVNYVTQNSGYLYLLI